MRKYWFIFALLSLILSSCSNDEEVVYNVNNTLDTYLQRFIAEGEKRGHHFDLKSRGLRLYFGELEDDVAGRTYFEDPIRIVIDKTYWDQVASSQNADELYEDLVFHELGHGLLNRPHINDYLSNGDWKSIMCGGTERDGRSWNINYRSIRREYYLNELFDQNTPEPSWAKQITEANTTTDILLYAYEFNNSSFEWPITNNSSYTSNISGGYYIFNNKASNPFLVPKRLSINTNSDFYIETKIKYSSTSTNAQSGLIFGNVYSFTGDSPSCVNFFTINNNQRMFMGNTDCFGWYTELIKSNLIANSFNTLGIRKTGDDLYYFINGTCVYYDKLTNPKAGYDYGFEVAENTTLEVDYFRFYTPSTGIRSANTANTQTINPVALPTKNTIWKTK